MDNGKIGIKVADGSFYPILDEGIAQKKRLVLTTVKDNQESVQIDLYKGFGEEMSDANYVGSLLVENIAPDAQGNAEIELVVGVDEEGNLETVAEDKKSGEKQSLSVSLKNLEDSGLYEVPDFSFEEDESELEDIFGDEEIEEGPEEELSLEGLEEPDFGEEDLGEEAFGEELGEEEVPAEENLFEAAAEEEPGEETTEAEEPGETDFTEINEDEFSTEGLEGPDFGEEAFGQEELGEEESVFGELPDFEEEMGEEETEAEAEEEFGEDLFSQEEPFEEQAEQQVEAEEAEEQEKEEKEEKGSKVRPILVALLVILAIGLLGALLYLFVFMAADEKAAPPLQSQQEQEQEVQEQEPQQELEEQPAGEVAEAEEQSGLETSDQAPEQQEVTVTPSKDQVEFTGGVWYKIRWGDTLWEISSSFYDNPWLYDKIAEENEIRNPDLIYAENSIFIPKKK